MNCFVEWLIDKTVFGFISGWYHGQRLSPLQTSGTLQLGFEAVQEITLDFVERNCPVVITTLPQHFVMYSLTPFRGVVEDL